MRSIIIFKHPNTLEYPQLPQQSVPGKVKVNIKKSRYHDKDQGISNRHVETVKTQI